MDFLQNALGNDSIAKIAGDKVGDLVENTLSKAMSGDAKKEEEKGGGFGVGDALSLVTENKDENKGGFSVGDALSLVTENKKEDGVGVIKGLFN